MKKLNKLNTKILTFVLSLMMISTQASIVVASQNNVSKSSEEIIQPLDFTNSSTPASGAGYTWNSTSKTLTLSGINMNITPTGQNQYAILVPIGSKIISKKGTTNKIAFKADDDAANGFGTAIKAMAEKSSQFITITGDGILELNITGIYNSCINVKYGSLIIKDMPNLKSSSPSSKSEGFISDGKTTIQNSSITITAKYSGITASPLIIEDSTISISSNLGTGVNAHGESLIKNSNVTIEGMFYAWAQYNDEAVLTVDNSTVKATTQTKTEHCFHEWRKEETNGFIFKNGSTIRTSGGSKSVVTSGDSFIKFDDVDFYYNDIKITDYKTNAAFTSNNIIVVMADYSAVNEAIKKANKLTASHYKNFDSVTNAINAVVRDKINSQQDEVDAMATTIENAIQALVYKDADYRKVNAAISKIPSDLSKYTNMSVKPLIDAKNAVILGKNLFEQATVDAYATAIENARKALVYKDADYQKVKDAISKIPSDLRKYTDDSVNELNDALHAIQYDKNIMEQGIVDRYAINIENAIKNLTVKPVKNPNTPKTGDTTFATLYLFLTLYSLGTIIILKKKRIAS